MNEIEKMQREMQREMLQAYRDEFFGPGYVPAERPAPWAKVNIERDAARARRERQIARAAR